MLGGRTYCDDDIVNITDIGDFSTGGDALLCLTDNTNCCSGPDGEFYYPDGTAVGFSSINSIYRNRGEGVVRLNRRNDATSPLGLYRCDIPDSTGTTRSIYINIVLGMFLYYALLNIRNIIVIIIILIIFNIIILKITHHPIFTGETLPPPPPPVTCPSLLSPANGRVIVGLVNVGGTATYSCNTGYTLSGSSSRTCQSSGVWSGSAPTCQAGELDIFFYESILSATHFFSHLVQCPSLTNPGNGRVTVTTRSFNGIATYSCNTGYTLSGSCSRACQSSGVWSESTPTCQAGK